MWDPGRMVVKTLPEIRHWLGVGVDVGTVNAFSAHTLGLGVDNRLYLAHEYRYDSRIARRQLTNPEYSERLRGWLTTSGVTPDWIYVDPSAADFSLQLYRDGLPNVIPEAMAAGVLVVTSPAAATTEAIRDGVSGRVLPPEDASAWVACLRELRDDDALAERLRLAARAWVEENFDATRNAALLAGLYRRHTSA
jgi:hypothetical protein